jgi:WhiB family redox-sensing transcriptional regulator
MADWVKHAACKDMSSNVFFSQRGESTEPAKQVCENCPVKEPCLDYALANNETIGVWGGMSRRQRRIEAQRRKQAV